MFIFVVVVAVVGCFLFYSWKSIDVSKKFSLRECTGFSLTLFRNFLSKERSRRVLLSHSCLVPSHPITGHSMGTASALPSPLPTLAGALLPTQTESRQRVFSFWEMWL